MITRDNLKFAFDDLNEEQIKKAFESEKNYLLFELCHFNAGSFSCLIAVDYDEEEDQDARDNGNLFIDKDDFLQLFKESESVNPYLIELI
jgi:hypothetical protein